MKNDLGKKVGASVLLILLVGIIIGAVFSFGTAVMIKSTGDEKFCTMCHTMQPMADAYKADVHGGNNSHGLKANCVDCHLPHDSLAGYMMEKARTGIHDVWAELTYDKSKIDWQAKRKEATHFVFDSGCLHCHVNLKEATMSDPKGFVAHKAYFQDHAKKCVECHENVGHHNLGSYISRIQHKEEKQ